MASDSGKPDFSAQTGAQEVGRAQVRGWQALETARAKWLGLCAIEWVDEAGRHRTWEASYRKTAGGSASARAAKPDAVAILATVARPQQPLATIVVHQFRPPVNTTVVELPAGLVDEGESVQQAALRELREETGYGQPPLGGTASVVHVSQLLVNDPGMSAANMVLARVAVRLARPDAVPVPRQEPGEHIHVQLVPLKDLHEVLTELNNREGYTVDARLMHLAYGLTLQSCT